MLRILAIVALGSAVSLLKVGDCNFCSVRHLDVTERLYQFTVQGCGFVELVVSFADLVLSLANQMR
jgi:hypothetical protein